MKKLSLMMAVMLIITTLGAIPFVASADANILVDLDCSTNYKDDKNQLSRIRKPLAGDGISASDFFGKTQFQKDSTDKVFHFSYTGKSTKEWDGQHIGYNAPALYAKLNNIGTNAAGHAYLTYVFDVMFGNDTSSVAVGFMHSSSSSSKKYSSFVSASENANGVLASSSTAGYLVDCNSTITNSTLGVNKWHRVKMVFPINGQAEKNKLYVDDMTTPCAESKNAVDSTVGVYESNTRNSIFFPTYNTTTDVYMDNIKIYYGDVPAIEDAPTITISDDAIAKEGSTIIAPFGTSVSDLKSKMSVTNGSIKSILESTMDAESESLKTGDVVVAMGEYGRYSYYDVVVKAAEGTVPELFDVGTVGDFDGENILLDNPVTVQTLLSEANYDAQSSAVLESDGSTPKSNDADVADGDYLSLTIGANTVKYKIFFYDKLIVQNDGSNRRYGNEDKNLVNGQGILDGAAATDCFGYYDDQKEDGDTVFRCKHTGKSTAAWSGDHLYYNAPRIYFNGLKKEICNGESNTNPYGYKFATYDFEVMFGNSDSVLLVSLSRKAESSSSAYGVIIPSTDAAVKKAKAQESTMGGLKTIATTDGIGVGSWHNVRIKFPISGRDANNDSGIISVYVDDMNTVAATAKTDDGAIGFSTSGTKNAFIFPTNNSTSDVYLDNIKLYAGDGNIKGDKVKDVKISDLALDKDGNVTFDCSNTTDSARKVTVIVAYYKDSMLIDSASKVITLAKGDSSIDEALAATEDVSGMTSAKVFVWNTTGYLTPYCATYEFSNN